MRKLSMSVLLLSLIAGCERPSRYPDLNSLPQTYEEAVAKGATPIQIGDFKALPGGISISNDSPPGYCSLCYVGPCDRDESNRVRGTYTLGFWVWNDKDMHDPKDIAQTQQQKTGHIMTAEQLKEMVDFQYICQRFKTTDHRRCVPGST